MAVSRMRRIVKRVILAVLAVSALFASYVASLCLILYLHTAEIITVPGPAQKVFAVYFTPLRYYVRLGLPGGKAIAGCVDYAEEAGRQRRRARIDRDEQPGDKD